MKLRTAIKIQKRMEQPWRSNWKPLRWSYNTIQESRRICLRKCGDDKRIPYIPNDDELVQRGQIMMLGLVEAFIKDEDEKDKLKEQIWSVNEY